MRLAAVLALLVSGCVAPPDDEPVTFENEPVTLRSEQGRALARVSLDGERIVRGNNDFVVELQALATGASAELVGASAFMPAHGHGADRPVVETLEGAYRVQDVALFMPGRWEVTFAIRVGGAGDAVTFPVDVP